MGRIRTVKPEFNSHEDLSKLSCQAHFLGEALLCYADDYGYFNANPGLVRAGTFPLREDFRSIPELLRELQSIGYLRFGTAPDGKRYGLIVHFCVHQRVSHPTASRISNLDIEWEDSMNPPENFARAPEVFAPERARGTGNREQGIEREGKEEQPASLRNVSGEENQAALWLFQELGLANTFKDRELLAQVIGFEARRLGDCQKSSEYLLLEAQQAMARGDVVNAFWFKDRKFDSAVRMNGGNGHVKVSPAELRSQRRDATFAEAERILTAEKLAGAGGGPRG